MSEAIFKNEFNSYLGKGGKQREGKEIIFSFFSVACFSRRLCPILVRSVASLSNGKKILKFDLLSFAPLFAF
jgi:hypothetical protein